MDQAPAGAWAVYPEEGCCPSCGEEIPRDKGEKGLPALNMERKRDLSRRSKLDRLPPVDVSGVLLVMPSPYSKREVYRNCAGTDTEYLHRAKYNGKEAILRRWVWNSCSPYTGAGVWEDILSPNGELLEDL
mgnify:FL=1